MVRIRHLLAMAAMLMVALPLPAQQAKNIILMIADGAGYNTLAGTGYYNGNFGSEVFREPGWTSTSVSTFPLDTRTTPIAGPAGLAQNPNTIYNSSRAWDTTPVGTTSQGFPDRFEGYRWHKDTYPDSANTMVSVVTGQKTYNNAVNVNGNGTSLLTLPEVLKAGGKSAGVVSTVQFADATPAVTGGAHNVSRGNRNAIASEMLNSGTLNVIMGTGNPDYDNNGNLRATPDHSWVSQSDWTALKNGNHASGFQLIQDKAQFDSLAANTNQNPNQKIIGIAKSFDGTQAYRGPNGLTASQTYTPFSDALRTDVPTLSTMTQGALNILGKNANGMFLMVEGGGVDRAMHSNNLGRMIEEKIEFDSTINLVTSYLNANTDGNNWNNTLVIVTADHDHMLFGPDSDTVAFQDLVNNGAGNLPGHKWQFSSHSNQLVPLFARGPGSELIGSFADQFDAYTDENNVNFGRGAYMDQTEIYQLMFAAAVPEPSTYLMCGAGALAMGIYIYRQRNGKAAKRTRVRRLAI